MLSLLLMQQISAAQLVYDAQMLGHAQLAQLESQDMVVMDCFACHHNMLNARHQQLCRGQACRAMKPTETD
jgi:hypothetical protein